MSFYETGTLIVCNIKVKQRFLQIYPQWELVTSDPMCPKHVMHAEEASLERSPY